MNILITGAGRGIGFECVQQLAAAGHTVIAVSRNVDALKALNHPNIHSFSADISNAANVDALVVEIASAVVHLDALINNAGLLINQDFEDFDNADAHRIFEVNFFAPARLIQLLVPQLKPGSHVVNIGSMGGYQGSSKFKGLAYYSASKAALANLTECLAEELKDREISVNCLALGSVQTEMLNEAFPGYKAQLTAAGAAEFISQFVLTGHKLFNGKILPVSITTP